MDLLLGLWKIVVLRLFKQWDPLDLDVSEEKNFSLWPRDSSCDILVKNMAAFSPFPKSLPVVKVKRVIRLIALAGSLKSTKFRLFVVVYSHK